MLLSGGDPLICGTPRLRRLLEALADIPHLRQVRISTKIPAFLPSRLTSDLELPQLLAEFQRCFQICVQCHYDHPRELTSPSTRALDLLLQSGCLLSSQIALMRGINDDPGVLTALYHDLHYRGVTPGYLFHPRPVKHATHFQIPILRGLEIVERVRSQCSGPIKRFRYVLVQEDGKIELIGTTRVENETRLILRWHQVRRGFSRPHVQLVPVSSQTCWLPGAVDQNDEGEMTVMGL